MLAAGPRRGLWRGAAPALCLLFAHSALALEPGWQVTQYRVDAWTQRQGLPQETVLDIHEDKTGYLWLGTQEGLARFDGVAFESFTVENTPELGHNFVSHLAEDADGRVWFGNEIGTVGYYAGGRFTAVGYQGGFRGQVVGLEPEDAGGMLVAFKSAGLFRIIDRSFEAVPLTGATDSSLGTLARGPSGLWIGARGGLYRPNGVGWDFLPVPATRGRLVTSLAELPDGTVWFACDDQDLLEVRPQGEATGPSPGVVWLPGAIRDLTIDAAGVLWIASEGGLWRWRSGVGEVGPERIDTGPQGIVDCAREDREGSLWVGTRAEGLYRLRSDEVMPWGVAEGLPSEATWNVLETSDGVFYVSTDGGLARLVDGRVEPVATPVFPTSDTVALAEGRDGVLWVGTFRNGLFRRAPWRRGEPERWSSVDLEGSLPQSPITVIFEDRAGDLWVGSREGLARRRSGRFESVALVEGAVQPYVSSIVEDPDGTVWVATASAGLLAFAGEERREVGLEDGLPSLSLNGMTLDREGRLWIATNDRGLAVIADGRVGYVGTGQGLPFAVVLWLLLDRSDHLWLSTGHGLVRAATSDLARAAFGELARVPVRVFTESDGMRSVELAATGQPAAWCGGDGRLWFPTGAGLAVVDPARLTDPQPPRAEIRQLLSNAGRQVLGSGGGLNELPAGQGEIEILYTAPSFDEPEGTSFRYRLVGYDEKWREAGSHRSAHYTNLPPRRYRFEVAARHEDGGKFGQVAALELALAPTLAQSWPFRVVVTLLAASLALAAVRWRGRRLYALVARRTAELSRANQELEAAVAREHAARSLAEAARGEAERAASAKSDFLAAVSHELRTPLNAILGLTDLLLETPLDERQRQWGQLVQKSGEDLLGMVDDLLDLARIEHDRLELLARPFDLASCLEAAVSMARLTAEAKGLSLRFVFRPLELRAVVGDERRVRQVANNLLANAVKFTEKGSVTVTARLQPRGPSVDLALEVRDTGVGIPDDLKSAIFQPFVQAEAPLTRRYGGVGLGLAIATRICVAMNGRIEVESRHGEGSLFRATMVLARHEAATEDVPHEQLPAQARRAEEVSLSILTVEDDEINRQVVRAILLSLGRDSDFVVDGESALEAVAERAYDLVLLDLQLPGIDGFEVARRIRAGPVVGRPKIVALTASAMRREQDRSRAAGMDGFLSKPLRPMDLSALIDQMTAPQPLREPIGVEP